MNSKFLQLIIPIFLSPLVIFNSLLSKNNRVWIFGAWEGRTYNDNSKYLYEYTQTYKKNVTRAIWLTKSKKVYSLLKKEKKECYYFYSLHGIYFSIVAQVVIVSRTWTDLPLTCLLFPKKTIFVQLWHGTPLKRLEKIFGKSIKGKVLRKLVVLYLGRTYDMVFSGTTKNVSHYSGKNFFSVKKKDIYITGQPRNDVLLTSLKSIKITQKEYKKIILYIPTWRNKKSDYFNKELKFDLKKLDMFLKKEEILFVLKFHFHDYYLYKRTLLSDNILFLSDIDDIYPYLRNVDILITDYSSIYFDFLLLQKPMLFFPFDKEQYKNEVGGFYYPYDSVTPGVKVYDWSRLIFELKKLIRGQDEYQFERKRINELFNTYKDKDSSARVYKEIAERISQTKD